SLIGHSRTGQSRTSSAGRSYSAGIGTPSSDSAVGAMSSRFTPPAGIATLRLQKNTPRTRSVATETWSPDQLFLLSSIDAPGLQPDPSASFESRIPPVVVDQPTR